MTQQFTTHAEAQAAADKMNSERVRTNVEYVASPSYKFENGRHTLKDGKLWVDGWYVGMCSND